MLRGRCGRIWRELWGNPSSLHQEGRQAREAVETARRQVAALLGAEPGEIVFTASGTEADNLAIQGVVLAAGRSSHATSSPVRSSTRPCWNVAGLCSGWASR